MKSFLFAVLLISSLSFSVLAWAHPATVESVEALSHHLAEHLREIHILSRNMFVNQEKISERLSQAKDHMEDVLSRVRYSRDTALDRRLIETLDMLNFWLDRSIQEQNWFMAVNFLKNMYEIVAPLRY